MTEWVTGNVIQIKHWTDNLFSLIIHAPVDPFIAGQFTRLGLEINGEKIQRAYSYVNAPLNNNLEFYIVNVSEGKLSPFLHKLQPGDKIMITKKATGFFVLREIPPCENLWMIATGTALGPYLSMLAHEDELEQFNHIILIHAARFISDLSYSPQLVYLQHRYNGKLRVQMIVSRERAFGLLTGHIPDLIINGSLESSVNLLINAKNSHVMLCGNPQMVHDTQQVLNDNRNMYKHFRHKPGHITSERYW